MLESGQCQKWGKELPKIFTYNGFNKSILMLESGQDFVSTGLKAFTLRGKTGVSLLKFGRDDIEEYQQQ